MIAAAAAGLACACLAAPAAGSAFFLFSQTRAKPGTQIQVKTGGEGVFAPATKNRALPIYLAPIGAFDEIRSRADKRLVRVGSMRMDHRGSGAGTFTVPALPAGGYMTFVYCEPCARYSAGRTLLPFGPFDAPFEIQSASEPAVDRDVAAAGLAGLAAVVTAAVVAVGWRGRRRLHGLT